jgi:hypothetical protein
MRRTLLRRDVLVGAFAIAAAALLLLRRIHSQASHDEGVYLVSMDSLDAGNPLGRAVFASQGPGFYALLRAMGWALPHSIVDLRLVMIALAVAGCAGLYVMTRIVSGPWTGVVAVVLAMASSAVFPFVDHVTADEPGLPFAVWGLVLAALAWRDRRSWWWSVGAGASVAASISIKYSMVTVFAGIVALAVAFRPSWRQVLWFLGGGAVVGGALLIAYRNDLHPLWRDSVTLHTESRKIAPEFDKVGGSSGLHANARLIRDVLKERSGLDFLVLALGSIGAIGWTVAAWRHRERAQLWILAWPVASLLFLEWQKPLFDGHIALVAWSGAPVAAIGLTWIVGAARRAKPVAAAGLAVAVVAVYWHASYHHFAKDPSRYRAEAALMKAATKPGDMVVASDDTVVPFYARRPVPPDLVDTSTVRLLTGSLTTADILREIDQQHVKAVLSGKRFNDAALLAGLRQRFAQARPEPPFGTLWTARR